MQRTIGLELPKYKELCDLIYSYNSIANEHICEALCNNTISKSRLHQLLYSRIRKDQPNFPSALIQCARDNAVEMLKGNQFNTFTRKRIDSSIRFDLRTCKVFLLSGELQLTTLEGRKKYTIKIPNYFQKYFSWKVKAVTLGIEKKYLKLKVIIEGENPKQCIYHEVLGIDLGLKEFAVLSDGHFAPSTQINRMKRKYAHNRKILQSKGTRSAKKKLKYLSGRERRFMLGYNHLLTKKIASLPYGAFALEDLKGIRNGKKGRVFNRKRNSWAYFQFRKMLEYKAQNKGKQVILVDPKYTSQECNFCGYIDKENRKEITFHCKECGFQCHADLNASKNISLRGYKIFYRQAVVNQPYISNYEINKDRV
ncbi:transposase [Candidatus Woesearchaeota archaeon]|nr:transposase [Candidatus Woesearchaeota archaeon]